jgi:hypothetical protein
MFEPSSLKPSPSPVMKTGQVIPALSRELEPHLKTLKARTSPAVFSIMVETINNLESAGPEDDAYVFTQPPVGQATRRLDKLYQDSQKFRPTAPPEPMPELDD